MAWTLLDPNNPYFADAALRQYIDEESTALAEDLGEHYCPLTGTLCPYGGKCPECKTVGEAHASASNVVMKDCVVGEPEVQFPSAPPILKLDALWALIDHLEGTKPPRLKDKTEAAKLELEAIAPRDA